MRLNDTWLLVRILILAALIALSACANTPWLQRECTQDQWLVDPNCK
jgi:hypothetical protein